MLNKKQQDTLEVALGDLKTKEALLDELQTLRDKFNALLVKLDLDGGVGDTGPVTGYEAILEIGPIRQKNKKTRL